MALAPSPTKDTKLVLSMSIQMPKQKIRLPRTWQEEMGIWRWAKARGTGEGISGQGAGAGAGAGLGSHVATHEEEEVENEEEVFDEAEAAVLGRHLHLRGVGSPWEGQKRRGVGPGGDEQKDRSCERQRGRKEEHRERGSLPAPPRPPASSGAPPPPSTGEVAFWSVSAPPCLPHLPHWDTHLYWRGLGIFGHQGHAGYSLPGLHGSGWGTPELLASTYSGHQDPRPALDSSRPHRHSDLTAC